MAPLLLRLVHHISFRLLRSSATASGSSAYSICRFLLIRRIGCNLRSNDEAVQFSKVLPDHYFFSQAEGSAIRSALEESF
jgi:hypothetical protein